MKATAVLINYPPNRFIGAELATHALLRTLQDNNWDVRVLSHTPPASPLYDGIHVRPLRHVTPSTVTEGGYPGKDDDVLITHSYIAPHLTTPLLDARARYKTPVIMYAHSARDHTRRAIEVLQPDFIISNSLMTARLLGLPSEHVVRPPLKLPTNTLSINPLTAAISAATRPPVAGYVNSTLIKGGELLLELTAQKSSLPYDIKGINGGYGEQLASAGEPIPHSDMPARYYSQIGVHLQLSTSESWGSTAIEALAHGVPVISTALPGPREALHQIPGRYIRWLPEPPDPRYSLKYLDSQIRSLLFSPPPTEEDKHKLSAALIALSRASELDRRLMEEYLRRTYAPH